MHPSARDVSANSESKKQGYIIGLITDGRSITQRNKLRSLNIVNHFDKIIITEEFGSDKTNENNFTTFHELQASHYYYIGDNPAKDFYHPNKLGWTTICLKDKGTNIHKQDVIVAMDYEPKYFIDSIEELVKLL